MNQMFSLYMQYRQAGASSLAAAEQVARKLGRRPLSELPELAERLRRAEERDLPHGTKQSIRTETAI